MSSYETDQSELFKKSQPVTSVYGMDRSTRRGFLTQSALLAGAISSGFSVVSGQEKSQAAKSAAPSIPLIDTHQHLWDLKTQNLPWLKGSPEVLNHTYWLKEYAAATEGLNVIKAVYMEVDIDPAQQVMEADTLLEICQAKKTPTVAAVISGRPDSEGFAAYIRKYAGKPEIRGVRQVLHGESTEKGYCLRPQFVKSMSLLGELGLSYDLCMRPGELSDGVALAKKCPGTMFIVDHCGNADPGAFLAKPSAPLPHDPKQWKSDIQALAACSNVICKISGIIASAPKDIPFAESLAPVVNHCLDSFGPDRVVFGGDWPVCLLGGSFKDWVMALRTIIADRPVMDQEKLLHRNAQRLYRLPA